MVGAPRRCRSGGRFPTGVLRACGGCCVCASRSRGGTVVVPDSDGQAACVLCAY
ncbi:hypothetical protein K788_0002629 [Paraburkholderia caribensis MBA4]|uniref:Uncharacterized protein n=1 Tax=Paraburkholderia caribensis MBA4 TaxID=1323664 RepID=A0A0P0R7G4_9BURK|nr:hypothetical protein K788_0002629 [Paraburkholderia caribensis MBA4]